MPLTVPDQSIAASIKPPDMLNTLSSIMQYKNAQQNLQTNQLNYQVANTANQKLNQLRDIAADPTMRNSDGSYNQQKFSDTAATLGPDSQAAQTNALSLQGKGIANQGAQVDLSGKIKDASDAQVAALTSDPNIAALGDPSVQADPAKLAAAQMGAKAVLHQAGAAMIAAGVDPATAAHRVQILANEVDQTPGSLRQHLANIAQQRLSGASQVAQNQVPVSQQNQYGTDQVNNPTVSGKDQFGNPTGVSGASVGGTTVAPTVLPQGETPESRTEQIKARLSSNNAAGQAGNQHAYSQNVIRIGSDPAFQNPNTWAASGARVTAKLGLPAGTDYQTALDMVGHNLAMATQANEAAMGVHTDAGGARSEAATGSLKMTPQAMVSAAKMNDATTTGVENFNRGMESAIKGAGGSVFARRDFQNEWSKAYSPVVMQLYNAKKAGDTAEIDSIIKSTGYTGDPKQFAQSPQGQEIVRRAKIIGALTSTGKPPANGGQ